jgi:hypothetical protein
MSVVNDSNASLPASDLDSNQARLDDLIPLFGGGFALAGVAIIGCALINALGFAIFNSFYGGDDPASWPAAVVVGFGVFAVLVSLFVGRWMINLRRWIGQKGEAGDAEMIRRKRRSFTIGVLCLYVPVSPLLWVFFIALANSADTV